MNENAEVVNNNFIQTAAIGPQDNGILINIII